MGLRAQICPQCQPRLNCAPIPDLLAAGPCEVHCTFFIQLPRLAQFFERHRAQPPTEYEDFVLKMLSESAAIMPSDVAGVAAGPFLDYAPEALAILERVVAMSVMPDIK